MYWYLFPSLQLLFIKIKTCMEFETLMIKYIYQNLKFKIILDKTS